MSKYASISIIIVIRIESRIKVYNIRNNSKHTPLALWIQGVAVVLRRIDCNLAVILSRSVLSVRVLVVTFVALRRSVTVIKTEKEREEIQKQETRMRQMEVKSQNQKRCANSLFCLHV